MGENVEGLVEHLFRRESGRMVAALVRSFGPAHLGLAEEVVQEALIQALRRWPFHGVPERPAAWLYRVARNLALDHLRRDTTFHGKEEEIRAALTPPDERDGPGEVYLAGEITDDQLRLIFLCCHPELARDARVALTLKSVCGFSVAEIARAFLAAKPTIAQRLVRAQHRIRERRIPFEVPPPDELPARLDTVLEVLYLMFNEGYATHDGDELVRADLCAETLRLVGQLAALKPTNRPAVHALAALLFLQASRLPARLDAEGNLVRLHEQDRGLWDRGLMARAFCHLERSAQGDEVTAYHVQAAIAAEHARAASVEETDWAAVVERYDQLLAMQPSPIVALNRAVAVARLRGPRAGLRAIAEIEDHPALRSYYLLGATRGDLLVAAGEPERAAASFRAALDCPCSEPERRFLLRKLGEAGAAAPPTRIC